MRTEQPIDLMNALAAPGVSLTQLDAETFEVLGTDTRTIARRALERQILLHELTPLQVSLEEAYLELTKDDVEYHSSVEAALGAGKQA